MFSSAQMAGELKFDGGNANGLSGDEFNKNKKDLVEGFIVCDQWPVHIEIRQQPNSYLNKNDIVDRIKDFVHSLPSLNNNHCFSKDHLPENVTEDILSLAIYLPSNLKVKKLSLKDAKIFYHVYTIASDEPESLDLGTNDVDAASNWCLPTLEFEGLWESLIFEEDIKSKLLQYINSTLLFFERKVSTKLLPWNKVIFLHGPPGTGKTSLCKALAQKICIRFSEKYACGYFIEIHSHNLFSKWFSESGKLVTKLFEAIMSLVEDQEALVMLLIDEVETLAHCRKASIQGSNEPSDGVRVVNALLTHLDKIKRYPNVLIMTTSNITEAVDMALVDRADIKQYIGLPCVDAIYTIYLSCIEELQRTDIIQSGNVENEIALSPVESLVKIPKLLDISRRSIGLSGRTIRKLPLIAHALYFEGISIPLDGFLHALSLAVDQQLQDRKNLVLE